MERCRWAEGDPLYQAYHDEEWGVPVYDSKKLFECLMLEGFQAGLSWITILRKRENFREAFQNFDPEIISNWGDQETHALLQNVGIVRHRGKIEGAFASARAWKIIENDQGFSHFLWSFVDGKPVLNTWKNLSEVPSKTDTSEALSKALRKIGFKFCGPTSVYAFMQATGLVNDHMLTCPQNPQN
jgi:DNA-3-methyladenine glycosylase I